MPGAVLNALTYFVLVSRPILQTQKLKHGGLMATSRWILSDPKARDSRSLLPPNSQPPPHPSSSSPEKTSRPLLHRGKTEARDVIRHKYWALGRVLRWSHCQHLELQRERLQLQVSGEGPLQNGLVNLGASI